MLQLLESLMLGGYQICFACAAKPSPYAEDLESMGIAVCPIKLNHPSFNTFLQSIKPDIVLYDRFMTEEQFGWRVSQECPQALTILDTEDLHLLRYARKESVKKNTDIDLYNPISKRELASILRCDLSLIISQAELQLLQDTFQVPASLLWYIPFMEEALSADAFKQFPAFEHRKHFMFIGNYLHEPNVDAVETLRKEVWPILRKKLPNSELHIYGAYVTPHIQQMHKPEEGFIVKGRATHARNTLSAYRMLLAPLRFGAGLKGKFLDAIHAGTPSLTTTIGAEGIGGAEQWAGVICKDYSDMIQQALCLYADKTLWKQAQVRGIRINNTCFGKSYFQQAFVQKLRKLQQTISAHRKQHFLGEIMRMDTINSKKYMSLWIQEKNQSPDN